MSNVKLKHGADLDVPVPEYVQGHLLWEAMSDFRRHMNELTQLCWHLAADRGGPDSRTANDKDRAQGFSGQALGSQLFAQLALRKVEAMHSALRRAQAMAGGEVYDDLIDEALLARRDQPSGFHTIVVDDSNRDKTTLVVGKTTRIAVQIGTREAEYNSQPFVTVSTDDSSERLNTNDGPIMSVSINDADLYDNEGEGDLVRRVDRETIREILKLGAGEQDMVDEIDAQINSRPPAKGA